MRKMVTPIPVLSSSKLPTISILKKQEPEKPQPVFYTVKLGDTLTSIAATTHTSVERLYAKNTGLADPNLIEPDKPLEIPQDSEMLADRPLPVTIIVPNSSVTADSSDSPRSYSYSGNTYSYGFCTWYAKNMRPDLPNSLGNADTWFERAALNGLSVGETPAIGSVAVAKGYMHVAIVTGIEGNSVQVSEMNYQGWNMVSTRLAPISEFHYIY